MLLLFLKIYLALRLIRPCLFLISNMLDMLSDFLSIQTLFFANFFLRWAKKFQHEIIELALNRNTMPLLLVPQFALSTIHLLCINLLFYRPQSVWKEMFYKLEMPLNDTNSFIFNYQERLCSEYPFITLGWWSIAHLDLTRKLLSKTLAGCKIFIEDISGDTANALLPILQK